MLLRICTLGSDNEMIDWPIHDGCLSISILVLLTMQYRNRIVVVDG